MNSLATNAKTLYTSKQKTNTSTWVNLNINVKTALLETLKENLTLMGNSNFWNYFLSNNFASMSTYLKQQYNQTNQTLQLHSAYMIDSTLGVCNRQISISFLVDESGSIKAANFQLALNLLYNYVNTTSNDPA
jgi:hypothetical protein